MANVSISEETFNRIMRVVRAAECVPVNLTTHKARPIIGSGGGAGVAFKAAVVMSWDDVNYWNKVNIYPCSLYRSNEAWARTNAYYSTALESNAPMRVLGVVERATRFAVGSWFFVFPASWVDELPDGSDGPVTTYWTTWAASWQ